MYAAEMMSIAGTDGMGGRAAGVMSTDSNVARTKTASATVAAGKTATAVSMPEWKRRLYVALGAISVALGMVGAFVPGLPTTVFLIVASWFFTRSSPRLEARLLSHPRFGAPLRRFLEERTMPRRAKVTALGSMWGGAGVSCAGAIGGGLPLLLPLLVVCAALIGSGAVLFGCRTA
ncbi:MAG: YbaN family protein [Candidatus Eisenbacteria bacterium]